MESEMFELWLLLAIVYTMVSIVTGLFAVPVLKGGSDAPVYNFERLLAGVFWPITLFVVFALGVCASAVVFFRWLLSKT